MISRLLRLIAISAFLAAPASAGWLPLVKSGAVATTTFDLAKIGTATQLSGGNLLANVDPAAGDNPTVALSISGASSGKKYVEFTLVRSSGAANDAVGIGNASTSLGQNGTSYLGASSNSVGMSGGGSVILNTATIATIQAFAVADVICVAYDIGNQRIWFRTNGGNWNNSGVADPVTNTGGIDVSGLNAGPYYAGVNGFWHFTGGDQWSANFGASAYAQAVPSGFGNW